MPTLSIANPADREALSREAYKIVAANEPAKTEAETKAARKKRNADALTRENVKRVVYGYAPVDLSSIEHLVPVSEDDSTIDENIDLLLSEDGVSDVTDRVQEDDESTLLPQERKIEAAKRVAALKAKAKQEAALLSEQLLANLTAILRVAIPNVISHPSSDAELAWALAFQEALEKRIGRAKFAERYAAEHGVSKSSIERLVREGRRLWANLIQVALGLKLEPETVIEFLSTLPSEMQLRVAHVAEQHRAEWEVSEEVDRYKKAKRLSHGILNKLPESKIVDKETRLRLTELTEAQQKKAVAEMRVDEKLKLREADDIAKLRASRSDARFAAASSDASRVTKAVQSYLNLTPAERADILEVLGLHTNTQELASCLPSFI
jgi:hypothetical protein